MTDPRPYRLPIDFVGGPVDGDRRHVSYPFPDVMPVQDRGSVMRVGTYRLSPDSRRLVYRWEGWQ